VFANFTEDDQRSFLQAYLAGVSFMDAQVGRLLAALDQLPSRENTLIIFLGDHGYQLGERRWWNKNTLFDLSCHAPLLFAGPGVKPGGTHEGPVEFVDIFPTVADLCGLPAPAGLAGRSLRPVLAEPEKPFKKAAHTLMVRGPKDSGQTVRSERWRFTQWSDGTRELYDHKNDPGESKNLADAPEQAPVVGEMSKLLGEIPVWKN
jgi:iduronate 2-sulfatase